MSRLLLILLFGVFIGSCVREDEQPNFQAKYTYNLEGWESLGTQTLVMLDAKNSSSTNQQITFEVEIVNSEGKVFTKDTTIKFNENEREKNFQILVETEGEIKGVKVNAIQ